MKIVSSVEDEGVDDMADLPPLGLKRGTLLEYLSHVSEANLLFRGGLNRREEHLVHVPSHTDSLIKD